VQAPELVAAKYRAQGRRLTSQRQLIFSLLHDNATHPTADALFAVASKRMPGISLRTVYQTLDELSEMGEIQLMRCDGGALRFDPNVDDHHHALDAATGEVFDVYVDNLDALRAQLPEGFEVENVSIVFHGRVAKGEIHEAFATAHESRIIQITHQPRRNTHGQVARHQDT
jgi:Fe2+ or Zn2+ uptake regulation protein